jgi:hypothetical protein
MREDLKEQSKMMKKVILICILVLTCVSFAAAQSKTANNGGAANSLEEMLIAREKQKWESLTNGRWAELKDLFAEDFVSIGYQPDGSVKMTNKTESFAASGALPPDVKFVLSDFKIISADKKNAVITYQASGPIKIQATSHWTKRGKNWQTVFYQATMLR